MTAPVPDPTVEALSEAERELIRTAGNPATTAPLNMATVRAVERILAARAAAPDPTVEALSTAAPALVPQSAHDWAESHYVVFCDFSDPDASKHVGFGTREATWRDAPTTWGEVADILAARAAAPDALRVRIEALIERCRGNYADDAGGGEPLRNYVLIEELRALLEDGAQ